MVKLPDSVRTIFKIKRFSLHDGPGIRTTVFLKGCPLNCIWCHSPEGISQNISIWYNKNLCICCGQCMLTCPEGALELISSAEPLIRIDRDLCILTGECVKKCPSNALEFTGSITSVTEIMEEIEKDIAYYNTSGGGVTLSGGEPLYQPDYSAEILDACKKRKIHTAVETSLYCERDALSKILKHVDLFIIDMKLYDPDQHIKYTGKSNETIKENFRYIAKADKEIIVRIPMIKNITDTDINIYSITKFVHETSDNIKIEYVRFNPLAGNNYEKLGIPFLNKQ